LVARGNWNCLNGIWQAYSLRGWYATIVHNIVGVDLDEGGLTVYPYSGKEMQLLGLHFGEKTFDIHLCGSGAFVKSIEINGSAIFGTNKVPFDMLMDKNKVVVYRGETAESFCTIKKTYGIKISEYSYTNEMVEATLNGCANGECVLYSEKPIEVMLNEQPAEMQLCKDGNYKIQIDFSNAQSVKLACKKGENV